MRSQGGVPGGLIEAESMGRLSQCAFGARSPHWLARLRPMIRGEITPVPNHSSPQRGRPDGPACFAKSSPNPDRESPFKVTAKRGSCRCS